MCLHTGCSVHFHPSQFTRPTFSIFCECLVPRPCILTVASFPAPPASHRLQYGKVGEDLVYFLTWVTSWTGQIGWHVNHKITSPAHTHWSTTILSWKMAAHEGAFMLLFTRQPGGQRVLPSQDSEDTQQQFSHACPRSIKAFLTPFYPWCHSCEEMYQALSRFTILQAMGRWARAWERGYTDSV